MWKNKIHLIILFIVVLYYDDLQLNIVFLKYIDVYVFGNIYLST